MRASAVLVALLLIGSAALADEAPPPIEKTVVVDATPAQVWQTFTTSEGATTFFAPKARIVLALGGEYEMYFMPSAPAGSRGSEGMRVLAYAPQRMLAFTWNAPPKFPAIRKAPPQTWVVVLLAPEGRAGARTKVTLLHLGWKPGPDWRAVHDYFERAWSVVLERLGRRFKQGPIDWAKE